MFRKFRNLVAQKRVIYRNLCRFNSVWVFKSSVRLNLIMLLHRIGTEISFLNSILVNSVYFGYVGPIWLNRFIVDSIVSQRLGFDSSLRRLVSLQFSGTLSPSSFDLLRFLMRRWSNKGESYSALLKENIDCFSE